MTSNSNILCFILIVFVGALLPWYLITSRNFDSDWGPQAWSRSIWPWPWVEITARTPKAAPASQDGHSLLKPVADTSDPACTKLKGLPVSQITPEQISHCHQHSPLLWSYLKHHHVTPPPPPSMKYTFGPQRVQELLRNAWPILQMMTLGKKKKVFVEAGASEGVADSNTVWLEQWHSWTGVLIECHPEVLPSLRQKNRRATIVDVCLSTTKYPTRANLTSVDGWSPSSSFGNDPALFPDFAKTFTNYEVQTMPLFAILAALDVWEVDFFSLDIQSLEPAVLATFPFDLVNVRVWVIEVALLAPKHKRAFIRFMVSKGYFVSDALGNPMLSYDIIFIQKGFWTT